MDTKQVEASLPRNNLFLRRVAVPAWTLALLALLVLAQGVLNIHNALTSSSGCSLLDNNSGPAAEESDRRAGGPWMPSAVAAASVSTAAAGAGLLDDGTNIPVPTHADGSPMRLEERVRYLELKANAFMNFGGDPFFGSKPLAGAGTACKRVSDLVEFGCREGFEGYQGNPKCPGGYDHQICLDRLPPPRKWNPEAHRKKGAVASDADPAPCLVYDFGVRAQPQFGAVMARIFGCEVHAFDPSPVSIEWWKSKDADALRALPNYHFHPYGGGGSDGDLTLMEYDWGQVSILRYPTYIIDCGPSLEGNKGCNMTRATDMQKRFTLPVKTLPTIRRELGHENRTLDVLKVDVEGSEYAFLEDALDRGGGGLPYVDQMTLEWHHMPWDPRYGEGSSPPINAIVTLLHATGLRLFWQHSPGGWPSNVRAFQRFGMHDVRYNLASFLREEGVGEHRRQGRWLRGL